MKTISYPARRILTRFSRLYLARFGRPYRAYRPRSEDSIACDLFLSHSLSDVPDVYARIERALSRSTRPMDLMECFLADYAEEVRGAVEREGRGARKGRAA